jgi:hypothetical protein
MAATTTPTPMGLLTTTMGMEEARTTAEVEGRSDGWWDLDLEQMPTYREV